MIASNASGVRGTHTSLISEVRLGCFFSIVEITQKAVGGAHYVVSVALYQDVKGTGVIRQPLLAQANQLLIRQVLTARMF
jgi:hypothetical protein